MLTYILTLCTGFETSSQKNLYFYFMQKQKKRGCPEGYYPGKRLGGSKCFGKNNSNGLRAAKSDNELSIETTLKNKSEAITQ